MRSLKVVTWLVVPVACLLGWLPSVRAAEESPRWLVVTAPAFHDVIEPLCVHRAAQGHRVQRIPLKTSDMAGATLRQILRSTCQAAPQRCRILLVGAVIPPKGVERPERFVVPTLRGTISRMKGEPSDNGYGCMDGDLLPDVAVGRLPARSVEETRAMVAKIIAFEREAVAKPWRHDITLLVGHPGGSSALERRFASTLVQSQITRPFANLDPRWRARAVIHMESSPYCVPTDKLRETSLKAVRAGQLFSIYLGHSSAARLASTGGSLMTREDWSTIDAPQGAGILLSCGCYTCQITGWMGEGFGFAAIRNPKGPVAVIGAEGESYGAMGKLAFEGLLPMLQRPDPPLLLGDWWLAMKTGLATGKIGWLSFKLYDAADGSRGEVSLDVQREEHLEMWMLLGDPAMRLPLAPSGIALEVVGDATAGGTLTVRGTLKRALAGAQVELTLERPFGVEPKDLAVLPDAPPAARGEAMLERHRRMHDVVLLRIQVRPADGRFEAVLRLPGALAGGRMIVRARVVTPQGDAEQAIELSLRE